MKTSEIFRVSCLGILFIFSFFYSFSQPSWTRITPLPQENTLNCIIKIPETNNLIAVGEGSTVMISGDAGETWDFYLNPAGLNNNADLRSVFFVNTSLGFIAGNDETILKTTDGGINWTLINSENNSNDLNDLYFFNENTGFAVGRFGTILKTGNGGNTWDSISSGVNFNLHSIDFCTPDTGFIVGYSGEVILRTEDGGNIWSVVDFPAQMQNSYLDDICFVNETTGFIYGVDMSSTSSFYGKVFKTEDSGNTWIETYSDPSAYSGKMDFFDDQHGIIGCESWMYESKILITNDSGVTWDEKTLPGFSWIAANSICYLDQANCFLVGNWGKIYKSNNGGYYWAAVYESIINHSIYDICFADNETGYAMGNVLGGGSCFELIKTTDGGDTWFSIFFNMGTFGGLDFINPDTGFVVSTDLVNSFYKTYDGGENWISSSPFDYNYEPYCIRFYDAMNGLVGGVGDIYKTSDGGINWQVVNSQQQGVFYDIEYKNADTCFAVGSKLIMSSDGGNSWTNMNLGIQFYLKDLFFINNNLAWLVGDSKQIFKSEDGGLTWSQIFVNTPNNITLNGVYFADEQTGYIVGDGWYETIIKTTDGGENWNVINSGTTSGFTNVYFKDEDNGFVFGEKGVILKTTTGGTTGFGNVSTNINFDVSIYPNPFSDEISITVGSLKTGQITITIFDLNGRKFKSNRYQINDHQEKIKISMNGIKPGIYLCRVCSEKRTFSKKIIKL